MSDPRSYSGYRRKAKAYLAKHTQCSWCGQAADTVDHILPLSKNGSLMDEDNWRPMCRDCNNKRGNGDKRMPQSREW